MRFDLKKKTWDKMASMQSKKIITEICTVASYIYVFYYYLMQTPSHQLIERLRVVEPLSEQRR